MNIFNYLLPHSILVLFCLIHARVQRYILINFDTHILILIAHILTCSLISKQKNTGKGKEQRRMKLLNDLLYIS